MRLWIEMFFAIGLALAPSKSRAEIVSFELHGTASLHTDGFSPIHDGSPFVARLSYERNVPRTDRLLDLDGRPPSADYDVPLATQYWYNGMQFLVGETALPSPDAALRHWFGVDVTVDGLEIHAGPFEPATIGIANDILGNGDPNTGGDHLAVIFPRPQVWPEEFRAEIWHPSIQMVWWDPTGAAFVDTSLPSILRPQDFVNPEIIIAGSSSVCTGLSCPNWSIWARIESVTPIPEPSSQILATVTMLLVLGGAFLRRLRRS
jgi:hypothetical protein